MSAREQAVFNASMAWLGVLDRAMELTDRERGLALSAFRAGCGEAYSGLKRLADASCWVQDCPRPVVRWMVSEMAPGRPLIYGVCGVDAALVMQFEQERERDA